jgi:uncharacterized protein
LLSETKMDSVGHFEIPYEDKSRALKFYQEVFGWNVKDIPDMNYVIAHTTETDSTTQMPKNVGAINGGFYKRGEEGAKGPVPVIIVSKLDESIAKVEAAGGRVVMSKRQVGEMGWYAQVSDSEENTVGVWEPINKSNLEKKEGSGDNKIVQQEGSAEAAA